MTIRREIAQQRVTREADLVQAFQVVRFEFQVFRERLSVETVRCENVPHTAPAPRV
jgi:hypothetical protein